MPGSFPAGSSPARQGTPRPRRGRCRPAKRPASRRHSRQTGFGGGIAHHIAGGQAQHPAEHHRRRRKLRAAARMALVQKIQHRVGPFGWLGRVTGVGAVLVQVAAHKGSYRVGVAGQFVFFFRCIAKFLQCAVVCAVGRRQVAALGVGRVGAFQPVQHTGIRVGTGGQQRFASPAREVVERCRPARSGLLPRRRRPGGSSR